MAFWSHSVNEDDVNAFDDYDPTPYSGGYNMESTYGQPLDPDAELCYPVADDYSEEYFGYETMQYSEDAEPNAYAAEDFYTRPVESYGGEAAEQEGEYGYGRGEEDHEAVEEEGRYGYGRGEEDLERVEAEGGYGYGYRQREEDEGYDGRRKYGGNDFENEGDDERRRYYRREYDEE